MVLTLEFAAQLEASRVAQIVDTIVSTDAFAGVAASWLD
jgi:hypothetical protein